MVSVSMLPLNVWVVRGHCVFFHGWPCGMLWLVIGSNHRWLLIFRHGGAVQILRCRRRAWDFVVLARSDFVAFVANVDVYLRSWFCYF